MGNPHTISFRNCCDLRLSASNESKVTNARWKTLIEHKGLSRQAVGRFRVRSFRQSDVETTCSLKAMGKTNGGSNEGGAAGDKQLAGGVASQDGAWAVVCEQ